MKTKKNSLVHGVGINDADYPVRHRIVLGYVNGVAREKLLWECPFHRKWKDMLKRCYSEKYQKTKRAYIGCTVSHDWLIFSNFKRWMEDQKWQGNHLDKDLLVLGNKIYSSETCVFIPAHINIFVSKMDEVAGCSFEKSTGKWCATITVEGESKRIGSFTDKDDAHLAWKAYKHQVALVYADQLADEGYDLRIVNALRSRFL